MKTTLILILSLISFCNCFAIGYVDKSAISLSQIPECLSRVSNTNAYAAELISAINAYPSNPKKKIEDLVTASMLLFDLTETNNYPIMLASMFGNVDKTLLEDYVFVFRMARVKAYVMSLGKIEHQRIVDKAVVSVYNMTNMDDDEIEAYVVAIKFLLWRDKFGIAEPDDINPHAFDTNCNDDFLYENRTGIHRPEPIVREKKKNKPNRPQPPKPIPYPDQF